MKAVIPVVMGALVFASIVAGEERDPNGPLNFPDHGSHGTPIDQDYFAGPEFTGTRFLVWIVETAHCNERVFEEFRQGNYNDVLLDLRYTLDRIANHPRALALLGSVATITNSPEVAIPYFDEAVQRYPQYAVTHAQYGMFLMGLGNPEAGIERLEQALKIDPDMAQAHAWLAKAYSETGRLDLAEQSAARARELGWNGSADLP